MVRRLLGAGVEAVGIERPDGPVVEALLAGGLTVYVIPPGQLRNLRSRYGSAGNKDDRFDAYVLADTVRTDRRRLRPLVRDTQATTALRPPSSGTGQPSQATNAFAEPAACTASSSFLARTAPVIVAGRALHEIRSCSGMAAKQSAAAC